MFLVKVLLHLLLVFVVNCLGDEFPEIKVEQGLVRGRNIRTENGISYFGFMGIPYAEPPVGVLRFQFPKAVLPWKETLDATKFHNVCPQPNTLSSGNSIIGDEDCLFLNVYTPQLPNENTSLLPVMFFIHGGSWFTGSARTDVCEPDFLISKKVILVTINYRLGALGFISTGDALLPGNNGLKDQALALNWTKTNIRQFGGDPDQITVFGQSAGGSSAHFHMFSPMSKHLLNGVIAQSGTAFDSWAFSPNHIAAERAKMLSKYCGCDTRSTQEMLDCLRKADAYKIIKETARLWVTDMDPMIIFKPVIEPTYLEDTFISEDPLNLLECGKVADVPLIIGLTTDDGAFRTAILYSQPELIAKLDENFNELAPLMLMYDETLLPKYKKYVNTRIRRFYFEDKKINESTGPLFTKMYTDAAFLLGAQTSVLLHSKYNKNPVFYYLFGYIGSESYCRSYDNGETPQDYGVCHGDDLLYLIKNKLRFPNYTPTQTDQRVTELMTNLWTNFAKQRNPTPTGSNHTKWEPYESSKKKYYFINRQGFPGVRRKLNRERAKFFMQLPLNYRRIRIRDEL